MFVRCFSFLSTGFVVFNGDRVGHIGLKSIFLCSLNVPFFARLTLIKLFEFCYL